MTLLAELARLLRRMDPMPPRVLRDAEAAHTYLHPTTDARPPQKSAPTDPGRAGSVGEVGAGEVAPGEDAWPVGQTAATEPARVVPASPLHVPAGDGGAGKAAARDDVRPRQVFTPIDSPRVSAGNESVGEVGAGEAAPGDDARPVGQTAATEPARVEPAGPVGDVGAGEVAARDEGWPSRVSAATDPARVESVSPGGVADGVGGGDAVVGVVWPPVDLALEVELLVALFETAPTVRSGGRRLRLGVPGGPPVLEVEIRRLGAAVRLAGLAPGGVRLEVRHAAGTDAVPVTGAGYFSAEVPAGPVRLVLTDSVTGGVRATGWL